MDISNLFGLQNRQIIIAGGAGQLGFHFAQILASSGASIHILDIDIDNAFKKIKQLDAKLKNKIFLHKVDVKSDSSIKLFYSDWDKNNILYGLINCFHYTVRI